MSDMENKFTIESLLLKYLYHETNSRENDVVEDALTSDWELSELFDNLEKGYLMLPKVTFYPKTSTLQNILRYSNEQPAIEPIL
jgi:hypothetical protein